MSRGIARARHAAAYRRPDSCFGRSPHTGIDHSSKLKRLSSLEDECRARLGVRKIEKGGDLKKGIRANRY